MAAARADTYVVELPERMQSGEDAAYLEFADEFGPRLRAYFVKKGVPPAEAEELAVSCVSDAAVKINQYKPLPGIRFSAWVYAFGRHALADWREHRARTAPLAGDMPAQSLFNGELEGDLQVDLAVRRGLARLSPADRAIIELRDLGEERDYAEIGAEVGIKPGAARARHLRALQRLQAILEKDPQIQARLAKAKARRSGEEKG